ncbi:hypothetical protein AB0C77_09550 [Streptomyces sp. NPDC048629]|uniref:hypothetical protein n=1 Tax=Streptomyces sp. NPDC048629 TaxID=3154824 RepID=UPI003415F278
MWDAVQGVSGALSAVVVIVACVYAREQIKESKHTRALQSLIAIHQEFEAPPLRKVRRRLRLGEVNAASLTPEDREVVEDLLQKLELIAFLVSRGLVELDDVVALFPSVPVVLGRLQPFIESRRLTEPTYAVNAASLARRYP